ncbi:FGGY family carbohydrate kinase [Paraburkholderia phenoliruptrix]|uniref:FGGY family carbohydrate kinase n=1 Tax=Paraburkholderia phenoliruptrix TaxID=252970 RepID=UPI002869C2DF|nr:FGGY family carbohydrate kinase [Paraburkholderia phenoliruptrix]WMY11808.1 FGGY family carbohydrate kinase [Paraburkholderia phenoliruptrix]
MKYVLAIDQGTSGTKALVFDRTGRVHARGFVPVPCTHPRTGFVEQDANTLYASVLQATSLCLADFAGDRDSIAGVGISNQRETVVLWDENGEPLVPAVSWQCQRSLSICERMREAGWGAMIAEKTGLLIDPYFSGSKLIWLNENDDRVRSAIAARKAYFGTVDSWLLFRLTNGASYRADYTNASRTMLFNLSRLEWDMELLSLFGLDGLHLPDLSPSSSEFGVTDFGGLLAHPIPIASMIGDSHAAAVGEGCLSKGVAKATMGTGSSIMMNVGNEPQAPAKGLVSTLCFATEKRVDYAMEGIIISAGSTPSFLKEKLRMFGDFAEAEQAFNEYSNGGVYLIPAFSGIGCPHWKYPGGAQIVGLSFSSSWQHVARAAYESIVYQIKDVIQVMEESANVPLHELYLDGGLVQRPFLLQYLADTLNRPVCTLSLSEISAAGAAALASLKLGLVDSLEEYKSTQEISRRVEPGEGVAAAAENHAQWLRWIERL